MITSKANYLKLATINLIDELGFMNDGPFSYLHIAIHVYMSTMILIKMPFLDPFHNFSFDKASLAEFVLR